MAHPFGKLSLELYDIYKVTQNIADKLQMDLRLKVKKKKNQTIRRKFRKIFLYHIRKRILKIQRKHKRER